MNINSGLDFSKSHYSNIVNNKKNVTNNSAIAMNLAINRDKENKYNFYYDGSIRYNISTSSIKKDIQSKYWTQEHSLGLTYLYHAQ